MSLDAILVLGLRAFGALYLVGGVWMARQMWFWARITPSMNKLMQVAEELGAETEGRTPRQQEKDDEGRTWWLFSGALLLAVAGVAMLMAHRLSVPILAAVVAHQMLYFIRQRRRELGAKTPEAAIAARPNQSTVNGFYAGLAMTALALWLSARGALI